MAKLFDSADRTRFKHLGVQQLISFCSRREAATDVISSMSVGPIVHDKSLQFCEPRSKSSREIPPEAVGGDIIDRLLNFDNCQPEVRQSYIPRTGWPKFLLLDEAIASRAGFVAGHHVRAKRGSVERILACNTII